jgi:uncharacterized protein (DUF849 family)
MRKKYILNFTPTGMIPTKAMTPMVPVRPEEIVEQVLEAAELGANMVHLHARDSATGEPTHEREVFAEIISGIRRNDREIVICVSTSGRTYSEFEKRSACLDLTGAVKPDFGGLRPNSLNLNDQASVNSPRTIRDLAHRPELEVFDLGMINYAHYLIRKGLFRPPYYFTLILGNVACAQANLLSLGLMIKELPEHSLWSAGGVGDYQLTVNAMSLVAGGGVRIGLEDNIYFDTERTRLATNRELLERIVGVGRVLGRTPYTSREARHVLGLS